jgi:hypothetical protein
MALIFTASNPDVKEIGSSVGLPHENKPLAFICSVI